MQCDVCGEEIYGKPQKVEIENARMMACSKCAPLGQPIKEVPTRRFAPRQVSRMATPRPRHIRRDVMEKELVENYAAAVRKAREAQGITQQELATRLKEKVTVIQKIETGKIRPDVKLSRMLEHVLRIKLLVVPSTIETGSVTKLPPLTLGDVILIKKKPSKI